MLTELEVKKNIAELKTLNEQRRAKYYRNISFYENTLQLPISML